MTCVLVTGANGFVGSVLCDRLVQSGYRVRAALRREHPLAGHVERVIVGEIDANTEWAAALKGVDAVMHLAARVHVLNDSPGNADLYAEVNTRGTRSLALACAHAGVRRFVYLSTIKVNGEQTVGRAYSSLDRPAPVDAYASSKWLAERYLMDVASKGGMEAAIVRPPLVYGPGVRANFLRLMRWVDAERPLPFGAIRNQRSLVSVWNLTDLLVRILEHPAAPGRVWMAADAENLSTPGLVSQIGGAMGRRVRLLNVPVGLLRTFGALTGRADVVSRLCDSLMVDTSQTRQLLDWRPPLDVNEGIARTVAWYLSEGGPRQP